jgi:hypothetical protein
VTEDLKIYLKEQTVSLEKQRKKYVRYNHGYKIVSLLKALTSAAAVVLLIINFVLPFLLPALIIVVVAFFLLSAVKDPKQIFHAKLKKEILPTIFKKVNPTFEYQPYGYNHNTLKNSEFLNKGFFANSLDIFGEDYVTGRVENIEVEFFEITFRKEVTNYVKTAGGCLLGIVLLPILLVRGIFSGDDDLELPFDVVKEIKIFLSGFFMKADFNKDFTGKVLMMPKSQDGIKDKMYEMFKPKNLELITVENPYINDNYNIYTSDNQLGYYVLSQSLIDRIQQIAQKESALPTISFINGVMYFLIPWDKNLFTSDIFKPIESENYFLPYLEEIDIFEKTVKDLSLDKRIWSKV